MGGAATPTPCRSPQRSTLRIRWLYTLAILREFRWTLAVLCGTLLVGTLLYRITPLGGNNLSLAESLYDAWMAMLNQQPNNAPQAWYLMLICSVYPLIGIVLIGEGIVRLAMLMISRRQGEKEWVKVMASTYRDHVIVCGVGHLGIRVLEQLAAADCPVIAIEKNADGRFLPRAKELRVPVLVRDMKEDAALIEAGVAHARTIIIATNDDMANIEVALDARRMNRAIRVVMRLFDQQIAQKIKGALTIDVAFSSSALAAPLVAAMSLGGQILSTYAIGDTTYVAAGVPVRDGSALAGLTMRQIETNHEARVLGVVRNGRHTPTPPPDHPATAGDTLYLHLPAARASEVVSSS